MTARRLRQRVRVAGRKTARDLRAARAVASTATPERRFEEQVPRESGVAVRPSTQSRWLKAALVWPCNDLIERRPNVGGSPRSCLEGDQTRYSNRPGGNSPPAKRALRGPHPGAACRSPTNTKPCLRRQTGQRRTSTGASEGWPAARGAGQWGRTHARPGAAVLSMMSRHASWRRKINSGTVDVRRSRSWLPQYLPSFR